MNLRIAPAEAPLVAWHFLQLDILINILLAIDLSCLLCDS